MKRFYVVLRIASDVIVYEGNNMIHAAQALEPGTCYGYGVDQGTARLNAYEWSQWFRNHAV